MRIEVAYLRPGLDSRGRKLGAETLDVYLTENVFGLTSELASLVFADPVVQRAVTDGSGPLVAPKADWNLLIEVSFKAGVTNPMALTAREALANALRLPGNHLPESAVVQTATQWLFSRDDLSLGANQALAASLHNPLIQQAVVLTRADWDSGKRPPALYPLVHLGEVSAVVTIPMTQLEGDALVQLSKTRLLALTQPEMEAIRNHYRDPATQAARRELQLPSEPVDLELEMLAQTWSEHCKHKIFAANIAYTDTTTGKTEAISSLYSTYIKQTTRDLEPKRTFLRSVFHDNAGVVQFDDDTLVCFKVETHNSPSALDPFGGAITGIVGVNRDILGTGKGAKPIFNTNYLCFGDPNTPADELPTGLLHPKTVLRGVHQGIIEGGNHSGIPTVAGGFLFDESYKGKPLVFCGTGGILPASVNGEASYLKHVDAGDLVVMLGGRVGKDGIHGATFSSLALDETSPTSAVQIGDPITQRKMTDFLLEARDLGLYKGITDNGAGGLSSSLGEMAESSGGVRIDLDLCPLKYQGLAPWEILVSESQERMSLAVDRSTLEAFLALARKRDVEGTVIGEFTATGRVDLTWGRQLIGSLSMEFLHKGLPAMNLKATWVPPKFTPREVPDLPLGSTLLRLLADPTVASKESLVRQYDHEVQARSVVKPFCGEKMDGPTEGAVLKLKPGSNRGLTVTHGVNPRYGDTDPYQMAWNAVDEAYRAHIALGGDPDNASVLDNFCWPDPVQSATTPDGEYKLAQLVKTCQGLRDACLFYGLPLISGKDSMKNDANMNGKKVSIRPTLLISLMGIIVDVNKAMTTDFLAAGDVIVLLGDTRAELAGSTLEKVLRSDDSALRLAGTPTVHPEASLKLYRALASALQSGLLASVHDLADGGLGVALAESSLGGRLGAHVTLDELPGLRSAPPAVGLFSESPGRFLASVNPTQLADFRKAFRGLPAAEIGVVTADASLVVDREGQTVVRLAQQELLHAWNTLGRLQ
ncbi:MAG: AIR synthase-related protein [Spirochaetales bacterium]